ncbi:MAG: DUF4965 domain-containing protein [Bacteroidales bacterium]|jgi:hypothetical protein|nr:DUF4965 domain-containing protein [Bacteroidales bacterium]
MKQKILILLAGALISCSTSLENKQIKNDLRAPACPLITIDPYTSAWSFTDHLYDSPVKHWTGKDFPLLGVIKVDGEAWRFMGKEIPETEVIFPTSEQGEWEGKYTTSKPARRWMNEDFDDAAWQTARGAFGTISKFAEATAKTNWTDEYIWVRRTVDLPDNLSGKELYLMYSNDDKAVFYLNGVKLFDTGTRCNKNATVQLSEKAVQAIRPGKNLLAATCHNPVANGLLDFGILAKENQAARFGQTAIQTAVDVQATQTRYSFTCGAVDLKLTFTAPLLTDDLELLSRPVNYITYETASNDGNEHEVEIYFEASAAWALNTPCQESVSSAEEHDGRIYLKTGSKEQNILAKKGDDVRIDWGYFYMVAEKENTGYEVGNKKTALTRNLGKTKNAAGKIMIGYDDLYSIQYFGENLRPYWNRDGQSSIIEQFRAADNDYGKLKRACSDFDLKLMRAARKAGGKEYAELCALAYRQAVAAHKLVQAPNGDLLFLSKENFSNGSIGTVDISYPSAPLFLYYNVELAKALLNHIFYYSESGKWKKAFAAHDIGTYPLANGQTYGGDMPVEETGNMLILTAAIAAIEGNAAYAEKHWLILSIWADYLVREGLDPKNQLCTDDFAGHFAHNANLSIKAILGIASYGYLAGLLNRNDDAAQYTQKAKEMAQEWLKMANDGDHYRLTFDQPGSWSQKYNLVWNKILKMDIFPEETAQTEIAYYLTRQNEYGLPLDNRKAYTKADWIIWTATMSDNKETFQQFVSPLYRFVNETASRVPMTDWYRTDKAEQVGFQARSVVGGYFIKLLEEKMK